MLSMAYMPGQHSFLLTYLRVKMMTWMWSQTLMMPASTATLFQMDLQVAVAAVVKNSKLEKRKRKVLLHCQLETEPQLIV